MVAWLRVIRLWADMVRVFPDTLTLIRDDLGDDAVERLGSFVGHPLEKGIYRPNWMERPSIPTNFPSLKAHSEELMEIFSMVRIYPARAGRCGNAIGSPRSRTIRVSKLTRAVAISRYRNGPIGEPYLRAEQLIKQLTGQLNARLQASITA